MPLVICARVENSWVPNLDRGKVLVSLAVVVANLAATGEPRGHTRRRRAGITRGFGEGARFALEEEEE